MSQNLTLHNLRINANLKRGELAKGTKIPWVLLYLYENGYLRISKKNIKILAKYFKVKEAIFNDKLGYPTPLYGEIKKTKFKEKLRKTIVSWPSIIINFVLLLASLITIFYGQTTYTKGQTEVYKYFSDDFNNYVELVNEKGTTIEGSSIVTLTYTDSDENKLLVTSSLEKESYRTINFTFTIQDNTGPLYLIFAESSSNDPSFIFCNDDTNDILALTSEDLRIGTGSIIDGEFILKHLSRVNLNAIHGEEFNQYNERIQNSKDKILALFKALTTEIASSYKGNFIDFLNMQLVGGRIIANYINVGTQFITFGSVFGAIFLFAFLVCLVMILIDLKKKKEVNEDELEDNFPKDGLKNKPLAKNWPTFLFIPETLLRGVVVILVVYSSTLLFQVALKVSLSTTIFQTVTSLLDITSYIKVMPYIPVATLLWFFIRLEMLHHNKALIRQILMFVFYGLIYYIFENLGGFYFKGLGDTYRYTLLTLFETLMPGNLPWGIACFSLIVLFLLTTPKRFKYKKSGIVWRCCAIIPISYLVGSYLYAVGTKIWDWPTLPSYLETLLYRKQLMTTAFAILYPFSIWLYRKIVRKKYGILNAKLYVHGNKYFFIKNLMACSIITVLALINYLMRDNKLASTLDMNKTYYIAYLIPLILFYHPHIGKRNNIVDMIFVVSYGIGLTFAYIYIAQIVLFFDKYLPIVFPYMF